MIKPLVVILFILLQAWGTSPPGPTIPEPERLKELASRRQEVMKRIGDRGVPSSSVRNRASTLTMSIITTGRRTTSTTLWDQAGGRHAGTDSSCQYRREILFAPPRDARNET